MTTRSRPRLGFVTCASQPAVLRQRLLASPCIAARHYRLGVHVGAASAAAAFNDEMSCTDADWLVWVHQDVFLPAGWDAHFLRALAAAGEDFPDLAVAGVYGIAAGSQGLQRAGHVLDRGHLLREPAALPCRADSLDELLFAVRTDCPLRLDPALGFDLYATDLVLAAQAAGYSAAVVEACCEHWSDTPRAGIPAALAARIAASGARFEAKWADRLPIHTPCFSIRAAGDVARQCAALLENS